MSMLYKTIAEVSKRIALIYVSWNIKLVSLNEMRTDNLSLPINNLFFDLDKEIIQPSSYPALDRIAQLIKKNNITVTIEGHTDNVGGIRYNQMLSQLRAEAVRNYLLKAGCSLDTIEVKGFGNSRPAYDNDTVIGRAKNRRVEVRISEQN